MRIKKDNIVIRSATMNECWKDQTGRLRTAIDYEISRGEFFNAR